MHRKAPSSASLLTSSRPSVRVDSKTIKLARSYYENSGEDTNFEYGNISSILEELYAWEKKLYKEVKVYMKLILSIHIISVTHICPMSIFHIYA